MFDIESKKSMQRQKTASVESDESDEYWMT